MRETTRNNDLTLQHSALALQEILNSREVIACQTLVAAGYAYAGSYTRALEAYDQAIRAARLIGEHEQPARHATAAGAICLKRQRFKSALAYYQQARECAVAAGWSDAQKAEIHLGLGQALAGMGKDEGCGELNTAEGLLTGKALAECRLTKLLHYAWYDGLETLQHADVVFEEVEKAADDPVEGRINALLKKVTFEMRILHTDRSEEMLEEVAGLLESQRPWDTLAFGRYCMVKARLEAQKEQYSQAYDTAAQGLSCLCERLTADDPELVDAYMLLGDCCGQNRHQERLRCYQCAMALRGNDIGQAPLRDAPLLQDLGELLEDSAKEESVRCRHLAAELYMESAHGCFSGLDHQTAGRLYMGLGEYAEANKAFYQAFLSMREQSIPCAEVCIDLAWSTHWMDDPDGTLKWVKQAKELDPDNKWLSDSDRYRLLRYEAWAYGKKENFLMELQLRHKVLECMPEEESGTRMEMLALAGDAAFDCAWFAEAAEYHKQALELAKEKQRAEQEHSIERRSDVNELYAALCKDYRCDGRKLRALWMELCWICSC